MEIQFIFWVSIISACVTSASYSFRLFEYMDSFITCTDGRQATEMYHGATLFHACEL